MAIETQSQRKRLEKEKYILKSSYNPFKTNMVRYLRAKDKTQCEI
jgi:hypothetical protein